MKREGIEKTGVAELLWEIQEVGARLVKAEHLKKIASRKFKQPSTKSHNEPGVKNLCLARRLVH
jgi:hypothetical protein